MKFQRAHTHTHYTFAAPILQVLVFRCGEQIELSFSEQREVVERGIDRITG